MLADTSRPGTELMPGARGSLSLGVMRGTASRLSGRSPGAVLVVRASMVQMIATIWVFSMVVRLETMVVHGTVDMTAMRTMHGDCYCYKPPMPRGLL